MAWLKTAPHTSRVRGDRGQRDMDSIRPVQAVMEAGSVIHKWKAYNNTQGLGFTQCSTSPALNIEVPQTGVSTRETYKNHMARLCKALGETSYHRYRREIM